ncbi:recombinase family protein [Streptomyces xanthophaeus]|uniref:recombinase family protein n=1 Tax=Streptomyces xanthophaeus TaxID=67385 RepID=UPI0034441988
MPSVPFSLKAKGGAVREDSASKTYVRRQEFEKATQAVMDGRSKMLGVWKTDRFHRRGMGAVGRKLDEFDRRQSRLVSVSEGLGLVHGRTHRLRHPERARPGGGQGHREAREGGPRRAQGGRAARNG